MGRKKDFPILYARYNPRPKWCEVYTELAKSTTRMQSATYNKQKEVQILPFASQYLQVTNDSHSSLIVTFVSSCARFAFHFFMTEEELRKLVYGPDSMDEESKSENLETGEKFPETINLRKFGDSERDLTSVTGDISSGSDLYQDKFSDTSEKEVMKKIIEDLQERVEDNEYRMSELEEVIAKQLDIIMKYKMRFGEDDDFDFVNENYNGEKVLSDKEHSVNFPPVVPDSHSSLIVTFVSSCARFAFHFFMTEEELRKLVYGPDSMDEESKSENLETGEKFPETINLRKFGNSERDLTSVTGDISSGSDLYQDKFSDTSEKEVMKKIIEDLQERVEDNEYRMSELEEVIAKQLDVIMKYKMRFGEDDDFDFVNDNYNGEKVLSDKEHSVNVKEDANFSCDKSFKENSDEAIVSYEIENSFVDKSVKENCDEDVERFEKETSVVNEKDKSNSCYDKSVNGNYVGEVPNERELYFNVKRESLNSCCVKNVKYNCVKYSQEEKELSGLKESCVKCFRELSFDMKREMLNSCYDKSVILLTQFTKSLLFLERQYMKREKSRTNEDDLDSVLNFIKRRCVGDVYESSFNLTHTQMTYNHNEIHNRHVDEFLSGDEMTTQERMFCYTPDRWRRNWNTLAEQIEHVQFVHQFLLGSENWQSESDMNSFYAEPDMGDEVELLPDDPAPFDAAVTAPASRVGTVASLGRDEGLDEDDKYVSKFLPAVSFLVKFKRKIKRWRKRSQ
eukprot:sb/3462440/